MRVLPVFRDINRVLMRIKEIKERFSVPDSAPFPKFATLHESKNRFKSVLKSEVNKKENVKDLIKQISNRYGIDPYLAIAVAGVESGYNKTAISPKGAKGIMQLMPSTAKELGVKDIFSVKENIEGGIKYLRLLSDRYSGDIDKILAAYNSGMGTVEKYSGVPPYRETREYIKKVKELYRRLKEGE